MIKQLEVTTEEFLKMVNKFSDLGDISVLDEETISGCHDCSEPGDVALYYDFCTDEATPEQANEFSRWVFDELQEQLIIFMASQGFKFIEDNDGSGNGLYYGSLLFRKA